jgi:hypothetical protein
MDWMLEDGQVICVTGSIPQLGMWQPDQMLLLTGESGTTNVPASASSSCALSAPLCLTVLHS